MPEGLVVSGLSVRWEGRSVLRDVSFSVGDGEFVTLMGPNGSGKTTLLRALVGLEPVDAGEVRLRGRSLEGVPTHRRGIGLLFQEPTLLPGRTVRENVAFGPEIQGRPLAEVDARVDEMLRLLRLESLADRPSHALSGGERQRVALARTLAARPALVLLDEPFASVDPELRADLRAEFRSILRALEMSVIHVTHVVTLQPGQTLPPDALVNSTPGPATPTPVATPRPTPRIIIQTITRQSGKP